MKVLELFAGTCSIGKAFESRGHAVYSVEWNKSFLNIDLYKDILDVTADEIIEKFGHLDVIWASPDCTTFSIAAISHHRKGNFGIGWDFNIDVSKIVMPAEGYYQVVLSDGSNTTFKDNGNGFECLNAHSKMEKDGDGYIIINAAQSKYHFTAKGEQDWVKDAEGNILTISEMSNDQRTVTDSTGRTYKINYNGNKEHLRVTKIEDKSAGRTVTYKYNGDCEFCSSLCIFPLKTLAK